MSRTETYTRMYQTPEWFDHEEAAYLAGWYPETGSLMQIYQNAGIIGVAERAELLPSQITRVFEFGSGTGAGLIALNMFAQSRGDTTTVTGSEIESTGRLACTTVAEMLDRVVEVVPDGLVALEKSDDLDVVVAPMFGPCYHSEDKVEAFMPRALSALREGGSLLVNSDEKTMGNVVDWSHRNIGRKQFNVFGDYDLPSGFVTTPHLVVRK